MRSRTLPLLLALVLVAVVVHADEDEENPHEKMTRSKSVCIDCHTKVPKTGEHAPDYFLVDAPSENCLGCHDENEHVGVPEHVGKEAAPLPGDENGKIACFTCHDPHPEGLIEGRKVHKAEINEPTKALIAARELPAAAKRRESKQLFGALLRFQVANGDGCQDCHASKKEAASWREKLLRSEPIRVLPRY